MSQAAKLAVFFSCAALMVALFCVIAVVILRYLVSVRRLIGQMKTSERELWRSLGSPAHLPMFHGSLNPFKGVAAQIRFLGWFLTGGHGASDPDTKAMVERTRRLFRTAAITFAIVFVSEAMLLAVAALVTRAKV